jgi:DNA-binding CsgD family transcriptional regulator/tetratricopeptide (TPR) repeat protein
MTAAGIARQEALAMPALLPFGETAVSSNRTSSIGSMRILEREAHLAKLTERLGEARRGSGRLVMVGGEAGIGKTALVDAFLASLPRGTQILRGGCDPVVPARPFAPIADIATEGGNGLREALASADRDRVFDRFLALLRRTGTGGVVVLEDLHWADSATLDLLKVVGRRLPDLPTLLVGTYRPHEVDAGHPLRLALGDMPPGLVDDLPVPALSVAAVESLARGRGHDATELHRATGGNAFFVTEILETRAAVPTSVRDAVHARVARMSDDAQRVLRATAVLGTRAELPLVSAVVGDPGAAGGQRECLARGMLEEHDGLLAFRHELARQAVLDGLPVVERVRLHQRALAALRSGIVPADAVRLMQHAIEAGHSEAIGDLAPRAAEIAGGLGAHGEAADYLAVALALPGLVDERRRAELLEQYAYECSMSDRVAAARSAQDAALAIWRRLGDGRREGNGLRALAMYMWHGGEGDRAREVAESSVATLETIEPHGRELAEAYAKVAQLLTNSGQDDAAARRWATHAIELAERLGEEQIVVHAMTTLGLAHIYWGSEDDAMFAIGWAHLEEAHRRARAGGLSEDLIRILINFVETARDFGRYDDAERYAEEATAFLREREFELYRHLLNVRIAQIALTRGRWDEAERGSVALLAGTSPSNQVRVRALETLGRLRARRGEPGAWAMLDEALAAVGHGELQDICPLHAARAEVAWLEGDLDRAGAEAVAGMDLAAATGQPAGYGELSFLAWRAGRIERLPDGTDHAYVLHVAGHVREAARAWRALGCPYDEALALADSDDEGDLRDALTILHGLRASVMARRVTARLVSLGARNVPRGARPSTRANPAGLSARELEILGLIRDGARNAEIAERLVLSPKTVDHHVSAILRKLGVHDRAAAGREADRLALEDGERPRPT